MMVARKTILLSRFSSRFSTSTPATCAIASTISTPGMTGRFGKCPRNGSIHRHVFDPDTHVLEFNDAVYQQERIAMREDLLDRLNIENGHWCRNYNVTDPVLHGRAPNKTR